MRHCLATIVLAAGLGIVGHAADKISVSADPRADFAAFKTFSIGKGTVDNPRPELDNRLFVKVVEDAIRDAMIAKGLKIAASGPDLMVTFTVTGRDINGTERGVARGMGPRPVRSTEGTLIIDLTRPGEQAPVWRGTYLDEEATGAKLVQQLPEGAKKLIDKLAASRR